MDAGGDQFESRAASAVDIRGVVYVGSGDQEHFGDFTMFGGVL